ncbi:uncharacterized protein SPSK_08044 [Sporothrix schenckii 1099-18]|uniref:Uncharacterized protein n=1 Tax=Sporothrix schenckii 1099-18 TaxID=1397361 RepID=A0A0F2MIZ1_SPOSC|nr:uncharacterized protein SPSK_08044 [Sporothrix schenckii 1099-18]KJR88141.1 hypothetical protein SPSK_08044 [Sporothrix schenckii 1099-18]
MPSQVTVPGGIDETGNASSPTTNPPALQFTAGAALSCPDAFPCSFVLRSTGDDAKTALNRVPTSDMLHVRPCEKSSASARMDMPSVSVFRSTILSRRCHTSKTCRGAYDDDAMPSGSKMLACTCARNEADRDTRVTKSCVQWIL